MPSQSITVSAGTWTAVTPASGTTTIGIENNDTTNEIIWVAATAPPAPNSTAGHYVYARGTGRHFKETANFTSGELIYITALAGSNIPVTVLT
jgi:hypothetical protein